MTRSLIRLDSIVRASLNNDCMTNRHDDRRGKARTESDSDITRDYNAGTRDYEDITNGYNEREWERERER